MRKKRSTEFCRVAGLSLLSIFATASGACALSAENGAWPHPTFYTVVVRPGDTLEKLGARYDVSPIAVAKLNGLRSHAAVVAGESLRIPAGSAVTRNAVLAEALDQDAPNYAPPPKAFGASGYLRPRETEAAGIARRDAATSEDRNAAKEFVWPVRGRVISPFGPAANGERNDGINIAALLGAPIHAAAAGTVTYAGDGLRDYGNLILIAHSGGYVTAYAHAQSIAVARGDRVEKGQIIGTAGETGGVDRPQLHFEIREDLKPLNLAALP